MEAKARREVAGGRLCYPKRAFALALAVSGWAANLDADLPSFSPPRRGLRRMTCLSFPADRTAPAEEAPPRRAEPRGRIVRRRVMPVSCLFHRAPHLRARSAQRDNESEHDSSLSGPRERDIRSGSKPRRGLRRYNGARCREQLVRWGDGGYSRACGTTAAVGTSMMGRTADGACRDW